MDTTTLDFKISLSAGRATARESLIGAVEELRENHEVSLRDIASEMLVVFSLMISEPELDFELSPNAGRIVARETMIALVKQLHDVNGVLLQEIASEVLHISSLIFSDSQCVTEDNFYVPVAPKLIEAKYADDYIIFDEDDEESEDEESSVYMEFIKSEIHKKWIKLGASCNKEGIKNEGSDWKYLEFFPEYAKAYSTAFSRFDSDDRGFDYVHWGYIHELMMSCIVHNNPARMQLILDTMKSVQEIIGKDFFDLAEFEENYHRYLNDIPVFEKIISYVRDNPGCQQKNVYKALSINGRKSWYMFDLAERAKKIKRVRHQDTWLLSAV